MAWRIVLQPNGRLARWSDIIDGFTHYNMTKEMAVSLCMTVRDMPLEQAETKVQRGLDDSVEGREGVISNPSEGPPGFRRWNDCLNIIEIVHGREEADSCRKWGTGPPAKQPVMEQTTDEYPTVWDHILNPDN